MPHLRLFLVAIFGAFLFAAPTASAQTIEEQYQDIQNQGIIFAGICEGEDADCDCRDEGKCTLEDILQFVVNIGTFVLGISGSIILLMFFYGGMLWITARGKSEVVQQGKDTMVFATVGLIIIMSAYAGVTLLLSVLKTGEAPTNDQQLEDVIGSGAEDVIQTQ
jgi:cytochrome b subunit of formate dehydrogenase